MSNEPMHREPTVIGPAPGKPPPPGRSVDAGLVLAAIDRMDAALNRERGTLDRLHAELAAMARIVAQAKIAVLAGSVKPDAAVSGTPLDVAALLDELEHRLDAMLENGSRLGPANTAPVEGPSAAGQACESPTALEAAADAGPSAMPLNRAPTVSGAMSWPELAGDGPREETVPPPPDASGSASSASVLETMVLALSALDAANHRDAEARAAGDAGLRAAEPATTQAAQASQESAPIAEDAAPMPNPVDAVMPENELMTNFARMEAFPIPPPVTGTAVIFVPGDAEPAVRAAPALSGDRSAALPADAPAPPTAAPAPSDVTPPGKSIGSDKPTWFLKRPDPLAALNAMSDAEKIALFS